MNRRRVLFLLGAAVTLLAVALFAEPALAQADPSKAGGNTADLMRSILKPVLGTIAGAIGIVAVIRRDWALAFTLVGLVIIVGSFLIENTPWGPFTDSVAQEILGPGNERPQRPQR